MKKFSLSEMTTLLLLADRIRREIDADLGHLVARVAEGDESALVPAVDKLFELGRPEQAERLKAIAMPAPSPNRPSRASN